MIGTFASRVRVYRALDRFGERADWVLTQVRGLGIESPLVKAAAFALVVVGLAKPFLSPHGKDSKLSSMTARLALSVWPLSREATCPGWVQFGALWAWVGSSPITTNTADPDNVYLSGDSTEADLWTELRQAFVEQYPAALLAEHRDGVRVTSDRATNVRRLTPSERELAARVAKYVDADVSTSVLLYGPQGSAKTTAACSIASMVCGSYFRLSADHVGSEEIYALVDLRPRAVVIDDIDRVHDVALLEMLDTLKAAGVIVFATSNTSPDARHGDDANDLMDAALVRSGRFDIHHPVYQLDPDSHAQICRDNGLAGVDLGPRSAELLASDLVALGRMRRASDLPNSSEAAEDLLMRRTNTTRRLQVQPKFTLTAVTKSS